jgi:hypothetical protein
VLQGLHLNWTPLAKFCRGLEVDLGYPAQANVLHAQGLARLRRPPTRTTSCARVAGEALADLDPL